MALNFQDMKSSLPWELLEESLLFLLSGLVCNSPPALGVVAVKSLQLLEVSMWEDEADILKDRGKK